MYSTSVETLYGWTTKDLGSTQEKRIFISGANGISPNDVVTAVVVETPSERATLIFFPALFLDAISH